MGDFKKTENHFQMFCESAGVQVDVFMARERGHSSLTSVVSAVLTTVLLRQEVLDLKKVMSRSGCRETADTSKEFRKTSRIGNLEEMQEAVIAALLSVLFRFLRRLMSVFRSPRYKSGISYRFARVAAMPWVKLIIERTPKNDSSLPFSAKLQKKNSTLIKRGKSCSYRKKH
ncbi:hypothetical protein TNCV_1731701 [Trichonephila clavipes]|nr:hypothetical protein TNCV_1731701 [Trichonephila clavipes]